MNILLKLWDGLFRVQPDQNRDPLWTLAQTEYRENPAYAYSRLKQGLKP